MREAFERAILENPDDSSAYAAYADWLQEQDDPRGEFIAVQLALENSSLPKEERKRLQAREWELRNEYERDWLDPSLAAFLLDLDKHDTLPNVGFWWGRGFLSEMRVQYLTLPLAKVLAISPATRFLRKLHIEDYGFTELYQPGAPPERTLLDILPEEADASEQAHQQQPAPQQPTLPGLSRHVAYMRLIGSPCLQNLRVFQMGKDEEPSSDSTTECSLVTHDLEQLVASMPRVEELYLMCSGYDADALFRLPNLTHLQTLRIYGLVDEYDPVRYVVPLHSLARNPSLGSLTHLLIHPHSSGTMSSLPLAEVHALMNSPHLTSLEHLQLRLSNMGDEGVRAIIESGKLKHLGWLDLRNGTITDYGAKAFAEYAFTRNLRRLDLSRNHVTPAGVNMLRRASINIVVDNAISRRESEARERAEREAEME